MLRRQSPHRDVRAVRSCRRGMAGDRPRSFACSACPTSRRSARCCDGWGLCRIVPTSSPACSAPGSSRSSSSTVSYRMGARVGQLARESVAPAVELGVPVLPVAVTGRELSRSWRVQIGAPVVTAHRDRPRTARGRGDDRRRARRDPRDHRPPLVSRATASDGTQLAFDVLRQPGASARPPHPGSRRRPHRRIAAAPRARAALAHHRLRQPRRRAVGQAPRVATTSTSWPTTPPASSTRAASSRRM